MKSLRFLTFLVFCTQFKLAAFAPELLGESPSAYLMPKGQAEISLEHYRVNDTLDVFDVRQSITGSSETEVGDMDGFGLGLNFGLSDRYTFLYKRSRKNYDFGRGVLDVKSESAGIRFNWKQGEGNKPLISAQLTYRSNRGEGINRIFSTVTMNGVAFTFPRPVKLEFGGVKDDEFGFMLMASKSLKPKLLGTVFGEVAFGDVKSELNSDLPLNELQSILDVLSYGQTKLDLGYALKYKMDDTYTLHFDYHFIKMDRDMDVSDPVDTNEILNLKLTKKQSKHKYWFAEAKYLDNQFIGEHSFLYNKRVASRSDEKYGYLGFGYTFRYGYGK
jgi:hypothetical protein